MSKILILNPRAHLLLAFDLSGGPRHLYRSRLSSSSLIYHHRFIPAFHRRPTDSPLHKNPRYARRTLGTADERERGDDRLVARPSTGGQGEATGAGATGWRRSRNGVVRARQEARERIEDRDRGCEGREAGMARLGMVGHKDPSDCVQGGKAILYTTY